MSKWTPKDTSKATGDSTSKVSEAFHQARNDAAASNELSERNISKVSDSEVGPSLQKTFQEAGLVGSGKDKK